MMSYGKGRSVTAISAAAAAVLFSLGAAAPDANAYPTGTIEVIVPFPAGGGTDTVGRTFIEPFARELGATMVVRNIGGASGSVGAGETASAEPDGYTLGYLPIGPASIQPVMRPGTYGADSFTYICQTVRDPLLLMVATGSDVESFEDLMDLDQIVYGSPGPGSTPHISMAALVEEAGIPNTHIPYEGTGPAMSAMAGGEIAAYADLAPVVASNDVRPLAVFDAERHPDYPDVPTMLELGYENIEFSVWHGVFAPAGLDPDIADQLAEACEAAIQDEALRERLAGMTTTPEYRGPEDFEAFVRQQIELNDTLLRRVGLIE